MYVIKEFPNYVLTDDLKIVNTKTKRILKPTIDHLGYERVKLQDGDRVKAIGVHRIVCMAYNYVPGCERLAVDHIDGNKQNNHPSNLEFVTIAENNRRYRENFKKYLEELKLRYDLCVLLPEVKTYFNLSAPQIGRIINKSSYTVMRRAVKSKRRIFEDGTMIKLHDGKKFKIPKDIKRAVYFARCTQRLLAFNHFTGTRLKFDTIHDAVKYFNKPRTTICWKMKQKNKIFQDGWEFQYENYKNEWSQASKEELDKILKDGRKNKPVYRINSTTGEVTMYASRPECAKSLGMSVSSVTRLLRENNSKPYKDGHYYRLKPN